jgi:TetR/AcrR family transcriptional regulator
MVVPERFAQRRAEILRSAAAAFHHRGYHAATVAEIAQTLQMTKGNLYHYFKNKEEILFFCHDYSLDILLNLLAEAEARVAPADQRLRGLIAAFVHMILDDLHGTALTLDVQALSPPLLKRVVRKRDRFDRGVRRLLKAGMSEGCFAEGNPKLLSFAILGALNWISRWYDPGGPAGSEEIAESFADYLVAGLRPAGAGSR